MPPKSLVKKHCIAIAKERWKKQAPDQKPEGFDSTVTADSMVLASLLTGQGYSDQRKALLIQNKKPVSESTFNRHQKAICDKIVNDAHQQCADYAAQMKDGVILGTDGCWNHPRNGTACTVSIFDQDQAKVVAFANVQKPVNQEPGNFQGSSNMMESVGIQRCFEELKPHLEDKKFIINHDHDNKTLKVVQSIFQKPIEETLDPIHAKKELSRKCYAFFEKYAQSRYARILQEKEKLAPEEIVLQMKKRGRKPNGTISKSEIMKRYAVLQEKLIAWFNYLVSNVDDKELRTKMWHNSVRHFVGDHSHCLHVENLTPRRGRPSKKPNKTEFWVWEWAIREESYSHELEEFLAVTTPLIQKVSKSSTQDNESINSKIAHYRDKDANFTVSNDARAAAAIGSKNDIHFESRIIGDILKDQISQQALAMLYEDEERRSECNQKRRCKMELQKKNFYRFQKRRRESFKPKSDDGYKEKTCEIEKFRDFALKSHD